MAVDEEECPWSTSTPGNFMIGSFPDECIETGSGFAFRMVYGQGWQLSLQLALEELNSK
jgi:hypothetical protein